MALINNAEVFQNGIRVTRVTYAIAVAYSDGGFIAAQCLTFEQVLDAVDAFGEGSVRGFEDFVDGEAHGRRAITDTDFLTADGWVRDNTNPCDNGETFQVFVKPEGSVHLAVRVTVVGDVVIVVAQPEGSDDLENAVHIAFDDGSGCDNQWRLVEGLGSIDFGLVPDADLSAEGGETSFMLILTNNDGFLQQLLQGDAVGARGEGEAAPAAASAGEATDNGGQTSEAAVDRGQSTVEGNASGAA